MNKDHLDSHIVKDENLKMVAGGSGFGFDTEEIEVRCRCCGTDFVVGYDRSKWTCPNCGSRDIAI